MNFIDPPAYVIPGEIKPIQQEVRVGHNGGPTLASNEEVHAYSLYHHYNTKLGEDGRTYTKRDRHGNYISHYVSPYAKEFWSGMNVEPGIEPVVKALWSKGYLTFTSCQGHEDSPMRYVGVTFVDDNERNKFVKALSHLPVTWHYNCVNPIDDPLEHDDGNWMRMQWDQEDTTTQTQKDFTEKRYTKQQLTDFWNIMFSRQYKQYSPVIMSVACNMNPRNELSYYWWKLRYKFTKDRVTARVADFIENQIDQYLW